MTLNSRIKSITTLLALFVSTNVVAHPGHAENILVHALLDNPTMAGLATVCIALIVWRIIAAK